MRTRVVWWGRLREEAGSYSKYIINYYNKTWGTRSRHFWFG